MNAKATAAIEYIRENATCGYLSADSIDDPELLDAVRRLLGEPMPSGYMSDSCGWRIHPNMETFDENETALAAALAEATRD